MSVDLPAPATKKAARLRARIIAKRAMRDWLDSGDDNCAVCGIGREVKRDASGDVIYFKNGNPKRVRIDQHHLLDRRLYPHLATEPMNRLTLCSKHHEFGQFSVKLNAAWFVRWLQENRPEQYAWVMANVGRDPAEHSGECNAEKQ
jgi:hypothetical protein